MLCDELPVEIVQEFQKTSGVKKGDGQGMQKQHSLEQNYQVMATAHQAASAKPAFKPNVQAPKVVNTKSAKIDHKQ